MAGVDDPLDRVIGAKSATLIAEQLDVRTVGDLLRHYPRRYADQGQLTPIASLTPGEDVTVVAEIRSCSSRPMQQKKGTIQQAVIFDGTRTLNLTFFNQHRLPRVLLPGRQALFAGRVTRYGKARTLQLTHPRYQLLDGDADKLAEFSRALIPVYPATKDLPSWTIQLCVRQVFDLLDDPEDPLPAELRSQHRLLELGAALRAVHRSDDRAAIATAQRRLKWDEAMAVQLTLARRRQEAASRPAPACPPRDGGLAAAFDAALPFTLTAGQREVGELLAVELAGEHPMNRLLQGEVGSGKTVVALRAMLQVVDAGRQAVLLAPTEVLAAQHARSLRAMLGEHGRAGELGSAEQATRIALLTGSLPARARKQALLDAASGAAGIVVGTHALIQDRVSFADLGMVVVDEQHRFGVEQRDALRARAVDDTSPHVLVMTATPIPRTVAMTVYGDLEVSALHELPSGRAPISTTVVPVGDKPGWLQRVWRRIAEEVAGGRQAYVVCPRIGGEDAASEDPPGEDTAGEDPAGEDEAGEDGGRAPLAVLDLISQLAEGPLAGLRLVALHGRLPGNDKDAVMRSFTAGEIDVLVATTVVEVGVDVPNATVMVIMDAQRFGVSQLHQLRGRVGRGAHPGLCLLVTDSPEGTAGRERLDAVAATTDGFELAQRDLELRREGDVLGAVQSGRRSGLKLLSLLRDADLIGQARQAAQQLVETDPDLTAHPGLARLAADLLDDQRAQFLEKV
ncbi:MAG: ATP-dependent DNA helicase RecG [Pseudonocardiales bacterium]|nr:ATP-dependent DNA helicase RecG [Actinomycetota bacterium]PZS12787.1 MAG: ATP-dependent DNA helicase RecG [Pseudonocardiales bacterium]